MDSLEAQGYFKQQFLKDFPVGRRLYKGLSLRKKAAVIVEEHQFLQSRSAAGFYDEIRAFKAFDHPLSAKVLDCYFRPGEPNIIWTIIKELKVCLEPGSRIWTEAELLEFLNTYLELFSEAQSKRLYYRNITTNDFRSDGDEPYRLCEHAGYYFLKTRAAYASPAIRKYLAVDEEGLGSPLPFHNPYKSEVYSLGVVAVELALGQYLGSLEPAEITPTVDSLPFSAQTKAILKLLLEESEERRLEPFEMLLWMKGELDLTDRVLTALRGKRHAENVRVIEARFEEAEPMSLTISRVKYISCVGCSQVLRINIQSEIQEFDAIIPLKCAEKTHIFCGQECLLLFSYIETLGNIERIDALCCPICKYHFPPDLFQLIRAKWASIRPNIDRTATMAQCRASRHSINRMSSPVDMPLGRETDIESVRCLHCRGAVLAGIILTHQEDLHGFCSVECLQAWGDTLDYVGSEEEIRCPAEDCERHIEVETVANGLPGGIDLARAILRIQLPQKIETFCLGCDSTISLDEHYASISRNRPVFLYCSPPDHAFCSKVCLQQYVERRTGFYCRPFSFVTCPRCNMQVDLDLIYDCYNGKANFQRIVQDFKASLVISKAPDMCSECWERKGIQVPCGHWFCEDCMRGWSVLVLRRAWTKLMPCPVCGVKINVEKYRKHENSLRNLVSVASARMFG